MSTLTVEEYAQIRNALEKSDYVALVDILDRHTQGGLKKQHYANWYLAFEQMHSEFAELEKALKDADASVAWLDMVSTPKATWERHE